MRNPKFDALLREMEQIHDKKNKDYAEEGNPYSNFEFAAKVAGCSPDTIFRALIGVKLARLDELLKGKQPNNESLNDTLLDLAVYSAIWASYRGAGQGEDTGRVEAKGEATRRTQGPHSRPFYAGHDTGPLIVPLREMSKDDYRGSKLADDPLSSHSG